MANFLLIINCAKAMLVYQVKLFKMALYLFESKNVTDISGRFMLLLL